MNKEEWKQRKEAKKAASEKRMNQKFSTRLKDPITLFTGALFLAAILQFLALWDTDAKIGDQLQQMVLATKAATQQAEAATNQLKLAYPPKIEIPLVQIFPDGDREGSVVLKPGNKIAGLIRGMNNGREVATIVVQDCAVTWENHLPMIRPWERKQRERTCFFEHPTDLVQPGEEINWKLEAKVPSTYSSKMFLLVSGVVHYRDTLGFYRYALFAWKYDPAQGVFIPLSSKDYPAYSNAN